MTATECRSRWITASIQNRAAIVILKEQTYVGWANVDHFKGMMKSPVLDCSERGPRERKRRWQGERNRKKKMRGKKEKVFFKRLEKKNDRATHHLSLLAHFIFPFSAPPLFLCTSPPAVSTILIFFLLLFLIFFFPPERRPKQKNFGTASKGGICMWLLLQDR